MIAAAIAHATEARLDSATVGGNRAAVAEAAQVLGGVEGVTDIAGEPRERFSKEVCSVSLTGILDKRQAAIARDTDTAIERAQIAVEVHGQEGCGPAGDPVASIIRVDLKGSGIDVGKARSCARCDDSHGRERCGEQM